MTRGFLLRPPGAITEQKFLNACTRCEKCIQACPKDAIIKAPKKMGFFIMGTPYIDPLKNPCVMCDDLPCISACPDAALLPVPALRFKFGLFLLHLFLLDLVVDDHLRFDLDGDRDVDGTAGAQAHAASGADVFMENGSLVDLGDRAGDGAVDDALLAKRVPVGLTFFLVENRVAHGYVRRGRDGK